MWCQLVPCHPPCYSHRSILSQQHWSTDMSLDHLYLSSFGPWHSSWPREAKGTHACASHLIRRLLEGSSFHYAVAAPHCWHDMSSKCQHGRRQGRYQQMCQLHGIKMSTVRRLPPRLKHMPSDNILWWWSRSPAWIAAACSFPATRRQWWLRCRLRQVFALPGSRAPPFQAKHSGSVARTCWYRHGMEGCNAPLSRIQAEYVLCRRHKNSWRWFAGEYQNEIPKLDQMPYPGKTMPSPNIYQGRRRLTWLQTPVTTRLPLDCVTQQKPKPQAKRKLTLTHPGCSMNISSCPGAATHSMNKKHTLQTSVTGHMYINWVYASLFLPFVLILATTCLDHTCRSWSARLANLRCNALTAQTRAWQASMGKPHGPLGIVVLLLFLLQQLALASTSKIQRPTLLVAGAGDHTCGQLGPPSVGPIQQCPSLKTLSQEWCSAYWAFPCPSSTGASLTHRSIWKAGQTPNASQACPEHCRLVEGEESRTNESSQWVIICWMYTIHKRDQVSVGPVRSLKHQGFQDSPPHPLWAMLNDFHQRTAHKEKPCLGLSVERWCGVMFVADLRMPLSSGITGNAVAGPLSIPTAISSLAAFSLQYVSNLIHTPLAASNGPGSQQHPNQNFHDK